MKRLSIVLAAIMMLSSCGTQSVLPYSVAHRGGHVDGLVPENSVAAVHMAKRFGYRAFECDVHYTSDSVLILMHDGTINRTMRNASDYSPIGKKTWYKDLSYEELRNNYVLASEDESLRTPLPNFDEILAACKETGMIPMLHSDLPEAYRRAYDVLGNKFVAFDTNYEALKHAREFSSCLILWDPGSTPVDEVIEKLKALGGRCGVSSMNYRMLDRDFDRKIREAGFEVQESIFPCPHEIQGTADASIVLSDFSLFPVKGKKPEYVKKGVDMEVQAGDQVLFVGEQEEEFGSMVLEMEFSGSVRMTVNGKWTYELKGRNITRLGSWRFHNALPEISIEALEDSHIKHAEVKFYRF